MDFFSKQCLPVQIYAILILIGIVGTLVSNVPAHQKLTGIGASLLWSALWGYLMIQLCKRGHEGWSWVILFLPVIIWTVVLMLMAFGLLRPPLAPISKK